MQMLKYKNYVELTSFSVVHTLKYAITEISRKWDCPSFLLLQAQKSGTVPPKVGSWQVCNIADNPT